MKKDEEKDISIEADPSADEAGENLDDSVVAEENAQEMIKNLREKLKKAVAEKQEYLDGWQRAKADFSNANKRNQEMLRDSISLANEGLIEELLPTLQSFEMAFANKEAWEKVDKNWRIGVEFIYNKLKDTLAAHGLKEINPFNQKFDAKEHEAVKYEPVQKESDDHKVISVIEKGYALGTKLLRPAKVIVGEYTKS
jgi:molecular chaperone GrpE